MQSLFVLVSVFLMLSSLLPFTVETVNRREGSSGFMGEDRIRTDMIGPKEAIGKRFGRRCPGFCNDSTRQEM